MRLCMDEDCPNTTNAATSDMIFVFIRQSRSFCPDRVLIGVTVISNALSAIWRPIVKPAELNPQGTEITGGRVRT